MEEARKGEPAAYGFPAPVRAGATRLGWIGIGVMGGAMAKRLLAAGYAVIVFARTPAKAEGLAAAGASLADSPAAVATASDVVFTMVGNPGDVREVVLDPVAGVLAGLRPGGVLVDCTSSSPALAREIAVAARAAGCHAVDAPVSGGDVSARDGTLAIFAGGDDEAVVSWLAPIFAHLGRPTYMGPPGSGQSSKIGNQIAVAGAVVGLGESLAFASAAGLDACPPHAAPRVHVRGARQVHRQGPRHGTGGRGRPGGGERPTGVSAVPADVLGDGRERRRRHVLAVERLNGRQNGQPIKTATSATRSRSSSGSTAFASDERQLFVGMLH